MNQRLIPQFENLVDKIAEGLIETLRETYTMKEYSVENLMLNVFTACLFKVVAGHLKPQDIERFCEQIKENLKVNFEAQNNDKGKK